MPTLSRAIALAVVSIVLALGAARADAENSLFLKPYDSVPISQWVAMNESQRGAIASLALGDDAAASLMQPFLGCMGDLARAATYETVSIRTGIQVCKIFVHRDLTS